MNKVRIRVRNFGPIREGYTQDDGFITFPKVALFCGPQGSGKSTITKLISSLMWLEKAAYVAAWSRPELSISSSEIFKRLALWHNLGSYFQSNTEIDYVGDGIRMQYRGDKFSLYPNVGDDDHYQKPKIMYMPAERNFLHYFKNSAPVEQPPLLALFREYVKAEKHFASGYDIPINGYRFAIDNNKESVIVNIHADGGEAKTPVGAASSGIQSILPLLLVSDYITRCIGQDSILTPDTESMSVINNPFVTISSERGEPFFTDSDVKINVPSFIFRAKQANGCFVNIVEEPEQNLFPPTQRNVLRKLLAISKKLDNNRLILSTHSPYVVSDLVASTKAYRLFEKANELGDAGVRFKGLINEAYALDSAMDSSDICLYETSYDGTITRTMDEEGRLKDSNYLNHQLKLSAMLFDHMFALEHEMEQELKSRNG